jgi:hypothetical protein
VIGFDQAINPAFLDALLAQLGPKAAKELSRLLREFFVAEAEKHGKEHACLVCGLALGMSQPFERAKEIMLAKILSGEFNEHETKVKS